MTRKEFIESCAGLSGEELNSIARELRSRSGSRIPPETQKLFRSLDDVTFASEEYVETDFGKTHVFAVGETEHAAQSLPVIVNVHGGGWTLEHTERDIFFSRRMAHRTNCLVVDVDYVLAPEYPYPAALEEIEAFLDRLPELLEQWGGNRDNIVLCGQSAGGNLVGAVMQRKRFTAHLGIKAQILCYLPTKAIHIIISYPCARYDSRCAWVYAVCYMDDK